MKLCTSSMWGRLFRASALSTCSTPSRVCRPRGQHVGAIFAGSGQLGTTLERKVRETQSRDVRLLGFVNQTQLPDIYAAADALVLPSEMDPRASVVNEAMAAGLPVVISSGTGVWGPGDLVRHGREGLVFRAADIDQLTLSCEFLLDSAKRDRMSSSAANRIQIWSYDTAAAGWCQAAHEVVGSCSPAYSALPPTGQPPSSASI